MNKRFGKLSDQKVLFAPDYIQNESGLVMNPSDEAYRGQGWKYLDIELPTEPPAEGYHYRHRGYTETDDTIKAVWDQEEDPRVYRTFSKLKLEIALLQRQLLDKFDKFLDDTCIEGSNYAIRRFYDQANELNEEHPMYSAYLAAAKGALGITDEQAEEILQDSEAD